MKISYVIPVCNEFDEIKICTHYKLSDGSLVDRLPYDIVEEKIEPVLKSVPGWNCSLAGISDANKLPAPLKSYIEYLETELQVPITLVSVGPDRVETILREALTTM